MNNPQTDHTIKDFAIGTRVKIMCAMRDFHFFFEETGTVIAINLKSTDSIKITLDELRIYEGYPNHVMDTWSFRPTDLCPESCDKLCVRHGLEGFISQELK